MAPPGGRDAWQAPYSVDVRASSPYRGGRGFEDLFQSTPAPESGRATPGGNGQKAWRAKRGTPLQRLDKSLFSGDMSMPSPFPSVGGQGRSARTPNRPGTTMGPGPGNEFPPLDTSKSESHIRFRAQTAPQGQLLRGLQQSVGVLAGRIEGLERLADDRKRSKSAGVKSTPQRRKEQSYLSLYGGMPMEGTLAARTHMEGPLRQNLKEMDRILGNVNNLLGDNIIILRNEAATKIQALVRGHIVRLHHQKAVFAARTWRRHEFAQMRSLLLDWVRWREVVELKIKAVRASHSRLMMQEMLRFWMELAMGMLPLRAEQEERALQLRRHHLRGWVRMRMRLWCAVSFSDRSRKAVEKRHAERIAAARKKLERMASHTGWEGEITNEMITRELESDAVAIIAANRIRGVKQRFFVGWRKLSSLRNIIKGKYMSSDRQRVMTLLLRCINAWWGALEAKKERWEEKGFHWSRRKVWVRGRRAGRFLLLRRYVRSWKQHTTQKVKVRGFVDFMGAKTLSGVFQALRQITRRQRELKREAIHRWTTVGRVSRAEPWRTWKEVTLAGRLRRRARDRCLQHMMWRHKRALKMRCLQAWKGLYTGSGAAGGGEVGDVSAMAQSLRDRDMELEVMSRQHMVDLRATEGRVVTAQKELAEAQATISALAGALTAAKSPAKGGSSAASGGSKRGSFRSRGGGTGKDAVKEIENPELVAAKASARVQSLCLDNAVMQLKDVMESQFYTPPSSGGSAADGQLREVFKNLREVIGKMSQNFSAGGAEGGNESD